MSSRSPSTPRQTQVSLPRIRRDWSASAALAGLVAVVASYSGPVLVALEAARASGLSAELTSSWVWAISVGSGLACAVLKLWTRQPAMVARSIPGAALLLTSLGDYSFSDAAGALVVACLLVRRWLPRCAVFAALFVGTLAALARGRIEQAVLELTLTEPMLILPTFSWEAIAGISIPRLIVTAAGQNAPAWPRCTPPATTPTAASCWAPPVSPPSPSRRSAATP